MMMVAKISARRPRYVRSRSRRPGGRPSSGHREEPVKGDGPRNQIIQSAQTQTEDSLTLHQEPHRRGGFPELA